MPFNDRKNARKELRKLEQKAIQNGARVAFEVLVESHWGEMLTGTFSSRRAVEEFTACSLSNGNSRIANTVSDLSPRLAHFSYSGLHTVKRVIIMPEAKFDAMMANASTEQKTALREQLGIQHCERRPGIKKGKPEPDSTF